MLCPKSPLKRLHAVSLLHIKSHMPQSKVSMIVRGYHKPCRKLCSQKAAEGLLHWPCGTFLAVTLTNKLVQAAVSAVISWLTTGAAVCRAILCRCFQLHHLVVQICHEICKAGEATYQRC